MSRVRYFRCYFLGYNRLVEILVLDFSLHPMCFSIQCVWLGSCAGSGFLRRALWAADHTDWLACWIRVQKGLRSNRSCNAVG